MIAALWQVSPRGSPSACAAVAVGDAASAGDERHTEEPDQPLSIAANATTRNVRRTAATPMHVPARRALRVTARRALRRRVNPSGLQTATAVISPGEYVQVLRLPTTCAATLPSTATASAISMKRNVASRLTSQAAHTSGRARTRSRRRTPQS